jgi:Zn-dependent M28 family amino/carboxypeptidase
MTRLLTPLVLLLAAPLLAAGNPVKPQAIAAHVRFLADDLLEGRETGSRGHAIAARYVAAQFTAAGLAPAGDDGTFFRRVPLRGSHLVQESSSFVVRRGDVRTELEQRKDVSISPGSTELATVDAPVVFVGYGIVAPEFKHDDYAGVDVRGKIVMIVRGAPASFPNNPRAYYGTSAVKGRVAADRGAIGMISVKGPTEEARAPYATELARPPAAPMLYVHANGELEGSIPELRARATISRKAAELLFGDTDFASVIAEIEKGAHRSFALDTSVAMRVATTFADITSENVVGLLRGNDPKLRAEHIVYSAHVDHLGVDPDTNKADRIYNGALDNGSGVASLIEIAKAFAALPKRPARSILFVALTGEEKGEQGAAAFADRAREQIVADINMDMFMMLYPVKDVVLLGGEHTTLGVAAARAARAAGFVVSPDPQPEEVRFVRSDQYAFVKKGIPAIHLKAGLLSRDASIDAVKLSKEWLRDVYHSPRDEASQKIDWESGARYAWANFLLGVDIANAPQAPKWKARDFFGGKFAR